MIPAFNEAALVGRTVATVPRFVDHVVVVDDASTDGTAASARAAGDERLTVIRHRKNKGVGAAIVTGYRAAMALGCDVAVVLAGDGQMDPDEMDRLIEPIVSGAADYVKGNRLGHPELERRMPLTRRLGNQVLTRLTQLVLNDPSINDSQCGYTAISGDALERLELGRLWPRYGYPNDLLGLLNQAGLRVCERPVTPIYGEEQSGIRPMIVLPTFGYVLARTWLRSRRA